MVPFKGRRLAVQFDLLCHRNKLSHIGARRRQLHGSRYCSGATLIA